MKTFTLILILVFLSLGVIQAQLASPSVQLHEAYRYQHVLELDDFLVLGRYKLPADDTVSDSITCNESDWDDCSRIDAFIDLDAEDGELILRINPPRIGPGIFAFYQSAAEFVSLSCDGDTEVCINFSSPTKDSPSIELYSSPSVFSPNFTSGVQTPSSDGGSTVNDTRENLEPRIISLVRSLEIENPEDGTDDPYHFDLQELVAASGLITSDGSTFAVEAFAPIIAVVPDAFENSVEFLGNAFGTSFIVLLTTDEAIGQTILEVSAVDNLDAGMLITVRDDDSDGDCNDDSDTTDDVDFSDCKETAEIISIDEDAITLTIDTDQDTAGNQGLVGAYTTALTGLVVVSGFTERFDISSRTSKSRTALEGLAEDLGMQPWAGGLFLAASFMLGFIIAIGAASGSFTLATASLPLMLSALAMGGFIPLTAVMVLTTILVLGIAFWVVRMLPA